MTDDVNSLISQLARMSSINTENVEEKAEDAPQFSKDLQNRAAVYHNAAAEERAFAVNPKIKAAQEKLPIFQKKKELITAMEENQVLIVIGETGSGKTTQLPQYLKEMGLHVQGRIGCTQLRRMAARAVARRVAREQGCKVGEQVGYTVRFDDCTDPLKTHIQYMTDGILLRECMYDRTLSSYSAIILDESHERTVDTDILLGVLRWILSQRNDLKLLISSATLDAEKFSSYFFNAKVFHINGRMYPVEIIYCPSMLNYVTEASKQVIRINEREEPGDIMVFMSGENDIEELADLLYDYRSSLYPELLIRPCYSALPAEDQARIFDPTPAGQRKVVIATNIAETSLTVDGIRYVVDSGQVKQKIYNNKKEMDILKRVNVSQAQAIQRTGRAGRVAPGKCFRLYSEGEYNMFVSGPEPEIKRSSLTSAILLLKKMGFKDLQVFHFIDAPPAELVQEAEDELKFFGAVDVNGEITELGKKMASFPLDPNLAKMLVVSHDLNCAEEILTIVALLSVASIFFRPKKEYQQADAAKARFFSNSGDLLTMLAVYKEWLTWDKSPEWCKENFIHHRMLKEVFKIREQLSDTMTAREMNIKSCGFNTQPVLKCICAGLIKNVAKKWYGQKHSYITLPKNSVVFIHPGSAVFRIEPAWIVYQKVVQTKKAYMRGVTPIDPQWLLEYAPAFHLA